jgi:uncharacterized membrane protein YcaP (DUF421 family)
MEGLETLLDILLGVSATKPEQLSIFQVCARAIVVFFVLIAYIRIGKKRFLGQATAFDVVLVIVIGSIASRAISGTAPFVASLAATLTLVMVHWVVSLFSRDSKSLSFVLKGHDTVIISNGRVDKKALRHAHMSDDDLLEDLRQNGIDALKDVKEARLERNGKLSVIKNG